jgi:undecaprenyl-diphosphatase
MRAPLFDDLNHVLFSIISAPAEPSASMIAFASFAAKRMVVLSPLIVIAVWLVGRPEDRRSAVAAPLTAAVAFVAAFLTEFVYFHPRPFAEGLQPNFLQHAANSSFPSDHATGVFALAFALLLGGGARARIGGVLAMIVAGMVCWGRVYLGVHFPLDIVGGALYALGAMLALESGPGRRLTEKFVAVSEAVRSRIPPLRRAVA